MKFVFLALVCGFSSYAFADDKPCADLADACKAAGFVQGGKEKNALQRDCVQPLLKGQTVENVNADPALVTACKEKRASAKKK